MISTFVPGASPNARTTLQKNSDAAGRLAGLEVLNSVCRFGDRTTMPRVALEGLAESPSVLREKPDQHYGAGGPAGRGQAPPSQRGEGWKGPDDDGNPTSVSGRPLDGLPGRRISGLDQPPV